MAKVSLRRSEIGNDHGFPASDLRRPLGQCFLRSRAAQRIISAIDIDPALPIYDLGAGEGALTKLISTRTTGRVVAVERDPGLVAQLRRRFTESPNVEVRAGDISILQVPKGPYTILSNPPFNLTAEVMRRFLLGARPPRSAHLVMEHDAAEKFLGSPRETLASLRLKLKFETSILMRLRGTDFWPVPRVRVVLFQAKLRPDPLLSVSESGVYSEIVVAGFEGNGGSLASRLRAYMSRKQFAQLAEQLQFDRSTAPSSVPFEAWLTMARFVASNSHRATSLYDVRRI